MIVDINRVRTVYGWLINIANNPNCMTFPVALPDIQSIKNGLIKISHDIEKESPYFSQELFEMKDRMFVGYGTINPVVFGQVIEILKSLQQADNTKGMGSHSSKDCCGVPKAIRRWSLCKCR